MTNEEIQALAQLGANLNTSLAGIQKSMIENKAPKSIDPIRPEDFHKITTDERSEPPPISPEIQQRMLEKMVANDTIVQTARQAPIVPKHDPQSIPNELITQSNTNLAMMQSLLVAIFDKVSAMEKVLCTKTKRTYKKKSKSVAIAENSRDRI